MAGATEPFAPGERPEEAEPSSIFFIGDSITFGWRDEDIGGWPIRLIAGLDRDRSITAYNLGVRGDTSERILARWHEEVRRRLRPLTTSVVVFAFGTNDARITTDGEPLTPIDVIRRNTSRIMSAALSDHQVLFIGPAPVDEGALARFINPGGNVPVPSNRRIAEVSEALAEETAAVGIPYLDLIERMSGEEAWYSALRGTDGLHPPSRGHDMIAAHVAAWRPWVSLFGRGDR